MGTPVWKIYHKFNKLQYVPKSQGATAEEFLTMGVLMGYCEKPARDPDNLYHTAS
jgi:hypothetical protein